MDNRDGVSMLRRSLDAPEKPEFPSAVGGYSRHEVNKYIEELLAANKSMKRVFYEKTQELRDELQLLSEENRNLKAEKEVMATLADESDENAGDKPSTRKIVEQVAGILKARHEAALFDRDEKMRALASALDMSELDAREAHRESEARAKALSLSSDTISDLESRLKAETAKRELLEARLEAQFDANDTDMRELESARERFVETEAELRQANECRESALSALAEAKAALERAAAERDSALAAAKSLTERLDSMKARATDGGDISTELEKRDDEIASLADMLAQRDVRIRRMELELSGLTGQLREREAEVERNRRTLTEIARLKERMARLDTPEAPSQPLIMLKPSEHEMRKGG